MRAWYVFIVVGIILSAGMLTYGYILSHETPIQKSYSLPPNAVVVSAPLPTPTPATTPKPAQKHSPKLAAPTAITAYIVNNNKPKFAIPKNYYHYPFKKCKPTYNNLIKLLDGLKCPHKYTLGKFVCSHFAAWLEWYLENHGFKTDIITVYWNYNGKTIGHAFDKVYTLNGVVYVDPTRLSMGFHGKQLIMLGPREPVSPGGKLIKFEVAHNIYQAKQLWGYYSVNWWDVLGYPPKVN